MTTAWFLHVRKAGGTAVRRALAGRPGLVLCEHDVTVRQVPAGQRFMLVVRDPVERAVSGFYDRLRCGAPEYSCPWLGADASVFAVYRTMPDLAADLASADHARATRAAWALGVLSHTSCRLWDWLVDRATIEARRDDLLYVMHMANLRHDFGHVVATLGLEGVSLPTVHVAPPPHRVRLGEAEVEALRAHYAADYECLQALVDLVSPLKLSPYLGAWARVGFPTYWEGP